MCWLNTTRRSPEPDYFRLTPIALTRPRRLVAEPDYLRLNRLLMLRSGTYQNAHPRERSLATVCDVFFFLRDVFACWFYLIRHLSNEPFLSKNSLNTSGMRPRPVHLWVSLPTLSWYLGATFLPLRGPVLSLAAVFLLAALRFGPVAVSFLTSAAVIPSFAIMALSFFKSAACFFAALAASRFFMSVSAACR